MRGKVAKSLRRSARRVLGPDAPHADYTFPQQRSSAGGHVKPAQFVDANGLPYQARIPAEMFDIGRWLWRRVKIVTGMPVFRTHGVEPRLTDGSIKGLTARFKRKYNGIIRRTV